MYKKFAFFAFIFQVSIYSIAQTSGPSQPEVQTFQAASITNMVETSTGQFQYNVPLFSIGGYPVIVNYNSLVSMDQEASMVGLGFNLNCGAIIRQVRGLPDDFKGDTYIKRVNMKDNVTKSIDLGFALELIGMNTAKTAQIGLGINYSTGLFYNSYTGFGIESSVGAGFHGNVGGLSGNAGIGLTSNSQHGTSVNPYSGIIYQYNKSEKAEKGDKWKKVADKSTIKMKPMMNKTSFGGSIGYNFNSTSYSPKVEFPFKTRSLDFSVKVGLAGALAQISGDVKGYILKQSLETNVLLNPAYGFLYAEKGKNVDTALMDFNRENEGIVTETTTNLPLAYATPDVYSVSGQGIGGLFELKRNNIFIGFDPYMSTNSLSGGSEVEIGFGTGTHVGADVRVGYVKNVSSKWNNPNNEILSELDFGSVVNSSSSNKSIAEQTYFKNPNDVMFNINPVFNFSGKSPISPILNTFLSFGGSTSSDKLKIGSTDVDLNGAILANQNRDNRSDAIYYLTALEASQYAIEKNISNYPKNNFNTAPQIIARLGNGRKENHLSELICLKNDGTKYVFDKPAYNMEKKDVSFSINDDQDVNNYLASAPSDISTPSNTSKGIDDFISVTEVPAYAHSFLLGSVLSPNYIDVDDNGPTVNDIGDYVKFNYTRLYTDYYWRSNNEFTKAAVDLGNLADQRDGKGFYSEGKKEIWYVHSIESKNEISRFYYSDRVDAMEINGNARKLQRLDSILIFTRPEILQNANPIPFKRVYFAFNQANPLCKGVLNDPNKGKLTLEKIYFKDGSSNKGKYSAYQFEYDNTANPSYNTNATDRWENYKPNLVTQSGLNLDNNYFPFTNQDNRALADKYAASWLLKKIILPSGGKITINYEAHDYAFVQNKRAMYMSPVVGITKTLPLNISQITNQNILFDSDGSKDFLIFKLKTPISGSTSAIEANNKVSRDYLFDNLDSKFGSVGFNSNLYGKFRVILKPEEGFDKEDIPVFLTAENTGALKIGASGNYEYGFIKLTPTYSKNENVLNSSQISKSAWQFTKNNYAGILMGMDADPGLSAEEGAQALVNMLLPVGNMVKTIMQSNPNEVLRKMNVAKTFMPNQSYIRLYEPTKTKVGGNGARVKEILINDNWQDMSGGNNSEYKIKYDYTKTVNNEKISSGVASYEPEIGGEENPWKQPILYKEKNVLMPDDNKFIMTPIGESLFPSAEVTYSEVKTTQNPSDSPIRQQNGYTLNKYYTFYDFPCSVDQTSIELKRKPKVSFMLIKNISNEYMFATQGYVVETNDMHGKPKSEEVFGAESNLISGKYYKYKTTLDGKLSNKVKSIDKNGVINNNNTLGVETQTFGDVRNFETESYSGSVHGNLDFQMFVLVPTIIPSIWPDMAYEQKQFASFTLTKHIRTQGIIDTVTVIDKGSRIFTKNELWDEKTGAVLLTQSINEFKDPIYSFSYPAHWAYTTMGLSSDNIGSSGTLSEFPAGVLQMGDILAANGEKYVVISTNPFSARKYYDANSILSPSTEFKIISSGKRNLATSPIGSLASLKSPIVGNSILINNNTKVIDAEAIEYANITASKCDTCGTGTPSMKLKYIANTTFKQLAPWQQLASYKFVDDRSQTLSNPLLRNDGFITNFSPFWNNPSGSNGGWSKTTDVKWQFTNKLSYVDKRTKPVESYNPIGVFNSGQPSNIDGQVYAVSNNARYFENFFESFEEQRDACNTNHFQIPIFNTQLLDNTTAHTGFFSMKVPNTEYAQVFPSQDLSFKTVSNTELVTRCAIPNLALIPGKKYVFSAWVKQNNATNTTLDYTEADVRITNSQSPQVTTICTPSGQIIDGWQRIEKEFIAPGQNPNTSPGFTITYSRNCNYDDIRIYPAEALMKSYVYSYKDYSLMAILDENNFATFYEYDQQKQLKRTKKETERGIATIQEVNFGSFKK
jgi:hypothetical protein